MTIDYIQTDDPKKLQKALKELIETLKKNNKEFAEVEAILLS